MKKILIVILLGLSISCSAQIKTNDPNGYINHFSVGYGIGFTTNFLTYNALTKWTDIKPWKAKVISFIVGVGISSLAGDRKEFYDMNNGGYYNKKDFGYTSVGGFGGSLTASAILYIDMPKRYYNKHKAELEF